MKLEKEETGQGHQGGDFGEGVCALKQEPRTIQSHFVWMMWPLRRTSEWL